MSTLALTPVGLAVNVLQAGAASVISRAFDDRHTDGARLSDMRLQTSTEGAGLPLVFGRVRLAGQVIWATRFRETSQTSHIGGKGGGPTRTDYGYTCSFAVALCEGEIDAVSRVWLDGREADLTGVTMRLYRGEEGQEADPLISAVEGTARTPAFAGVAYLVFEDLALSPWGNRVPQVTAEVLRAPAGARQAGLPALVQGVTLIPGSGEYAYAVEEVLTDVGPGRTVSENRHTARAASNLVAAIDDLEAQLPQCRSVMLVVSWFGNDLRAGECVLRPGVETRSKAAQSVWTVAGETRDTAYLVSQGEGGPNYGGTPSDASIVAAIQHLKSRGFRVGLYPFILMDTPAGSGLPDPYGGPEQAAFAWRGRITCHPAPGEPGTSDQTAAAAIQVNAFFGAASASDYAVSAGTIQYSGPDDWGLNRMVLHYASLCAAAGGVDALVIGSELRGLTQVRDASGAYPAVQALMSLTAQVRSLVGASTTLTYAADWSEYFGRQPADASGDVAFHLDPLWAHPDIDVIGVDWYAPLSDWRDGAGHLDAQTASSIYDLLHLQTNVEGGEGYDWYYATPEDRLSQTRTPITDGLHNEPWVYRYKDLRGWWSNLHYDRPGGVRASTPTAWVPQSKPIWLVELGCPAIDKGSNQPNVFVDPKSAESAAPYFSSGGRDDLIQRRAIEALLSYWAKPGVNPTSSVYGGPMLALDAAHVWTWDARPFPEFPARDEIWSDTPNWRVGHWLTGRLSLAPLSDVVGEVAGRTSALIESAEDLRGAVEGLVVSGTQTARSVLEPLSQAFGFQVQATGAGLVFAHEGDGAPQVIDVRHDLVANPHAPGVQHGRGDVRDLPGAAHVQFFDGARDHRSASVTAHGLSGDPARRLQFSVPLVLDHDAAVDVGAHLLAMAERDLDQVTVRFAPRLLGVGVGDRVSLGAAAHVYRVAERDADGRARLVRSTSNDTVRAALSAPVVQDAFTRPAIPDPVIIDAPTLPIDENRTGPLVGAAGDPWPGRVAVEAGGEGAAPTTRGVLERAAGVGELEWASWPGPVGRWDDANVARVRMWGRDLASRSKVDVLNGANLIAIQSAGGAWEIVQFETATLVEPGVYELRGLLRGLAGTESEMGAPSGARVVVLDQALVNAPVADHERSEALEWWFTPRGAERREPDASRRTIVTSGQHLSPLSPVHLTLSRSDAGLEFGWIRRARLGADDWTRENPPLDEAREAYRIEVLKDGNVVWTKEVEEPRALMPQAEVTAQLGLAPIYSAHVRVAQWSDAIGWGGVRDALVYT